MTTRLANQGSEHDVVIVGAGSAGCVIARRLIDAGQRVVLLEAGPPDDDPRLEDPSRYLELPLGALDWVLQTTPQRALHDRVVPLAIGRVLGGSSTINGMIFARGSRGDFDRWAAAGATGWSYDEVLPFFRRLERYDGDVTPARGDSGPLAVHGRYPLHPAMEAFRDAAVQAGIPFTPDYNDGEHREGVGQLQLNIADDARASAATAYLRPVSASPLLTLRTGCLAVRLLLADGRCVGVETVGDNGSEQFRAAREVVVAAGAYGSPKLLLLSGIGPAAGLAAAGIEPRVELPGVGSSLQDHVLMPTAFAAARAIPPAPPRGTTYQLNIFTRSRPGLPEPDLQLMPLHIPYVPGAPTPPDGLSILVMLVAPTSRGRMRLVSADPRDPAEVDPALLATDEDLEAMARGVEIAREIVAQPALASWRGRELFPGGDPADRAALQEALRRSATSFWHPAGTCRMGVDDGAVVDPQLRVHGVAGLRVVDASVMPTVVAGNTHATTVMIGERAAEMILTAAGAG